MQGLDIIKETIEYEQLFDHISADSMVRGEYLIPDTHPDVVEILEVCGKTNITNRDVQQDRIFVEGNIEYNVIYLAREEEGFGVHSVNFTDKIANYIDLTGAEHRMLCDADCQIEHINANIINERKIALESISQTICELYTTEDFEYVKDIEGSGDIEIKRKTETFDKVVCKSKFEMIEKSSMQVPMDKPQIGSIIKCSAMCHNKDVKINDGKINISCYLKIKAVYRAIDSRELVALEDDIYLSKEELLDNVDGNMIPLINFRECTLNYSKEMDDLGENRIINIEALIDGNFKIISKEHTEIIEDAYSPDRSMSLKKDKKDVSILTKKEKNETIIKDNIEIKEEKKAPIQIISTEGKILSVDKKIDDGMVTLDGILKTNIMYKTSDEEKGIETISKEIPFTTSMPIDEAKKDMKTQIKSWIDNIESVIEGNSISLKAIIASIAKIYSIAKKHCVTSVEEEEGEKPSKKSSLTIYVVQNSDTLWDLAKKYNTTINELLEINGVEKLEDISCGDKIIIPGRAVM